MKSHIFSRLLNLNDKCYVCGQDERADCHSLVKHHFLVESIKPPIPDADFLEFKA